MPTQRKKPRRTAERILEASLALFNRFGEPNVSTTLISAELSISPGNLYYHYASKDEIVNTLVDQWGQSLGELLGAAHEVRHIEDAWLFVHTVFELIWQHRFIYRDLNDLLSKNRHLELRFQALLKDTLHALRDVLDGLARGGAMPRLEEAQAGPIATAMGVLLIYWLNFEYVNAPREALEPAAAAANLARGAFHVLVLLAPHLHSDQKAHLDTLAR